LDISSSVFFPRTLSIALVVVMLACAIWRLGYPPIHPKEDKLISNGIKRIESGQYRKSYQSIRRAIALNPHNAFSLELIEILKLRWLPKAASISENPVRTYRRLTNKYPESPYLKILGAETLLSEGYQEKAQELLLDAVSSKPEIPQGWFALGLVQQAKGELNSAIISLRRAIELNPQEIYFAKLGELYFADQNWGLCLENLRIVAKKDKLRLFSRLTYLRCLLYTGKYAETIIFAEELIELFSSKLRIPNSSLDKINLAVSNNPTEGITKLSREQLLIYVKLIRTISQELNQGGSVDIENYTSVEEKVLVPVISYDLAQVRKLF